jgi:hypothetical protein
MLMNVTVFVFNNFIRPSCDPYNIATLCFYKHIR